jgi:RNA polymerase sigma-70 factor (ECF subfamily)
LAELLPAEPDALALAALVRYAEARRPARLDPDGAMVPLAEQDPARWDRTLIEAGDAYWRRCGDANTSRTLQAAIHAAWCARPSLAAPPPWSTVLQLYDALLAHRDDPIVRLNRAVALAEMAGPTAALAELDRIVTDRMASFQPYQAVRADLLRRVGRISEARDAYDAAIALDPAPAERSWLERRRASLG